MWGGTPGSPARVYAPNSFFADQSLLLGSGFTDSGWTSLNGAILVARQYNGSSEDFTLTGSTTSGAFTQGHPGAYVTQLAGTVQKVTDYVIASIVDATHVTLTSGPDADITTPAAWTVNPVAIMIRKKTPSADTVSLQFAQVKIQSSPGTSWGAQGGEICAPNDADDGTGKLGSLCLIGSTSMWIPRDGSTARPWGSVPFMSSGDLYNLGISIIGNTDQGVIGINPHDPRRIYSGRKVRTSTGGSGQGYDNRIIVAEYEGDFQPRSSTENNASIKAQYPAYGNNQIEYPWLRTVTARGKKTTDKPSGDSSRTDSTVRVLSDHRSVRASIDCGLPGHALAEDGFANRPHALYGRRRSWSELLISPKHRFGVGHVLMHTLCRSGRHRLCARLGK